jgi:ribosomal protein S28E/S33
MTKGRVEKPGVGVGVTKESTTKEIVLPNVKGPVRANDQFTSSMRRLDSTVTKGIVCPDRASTP